MQITPDDVEWVRTSNADPVGRVFRWDGGVYRAINHRSVTFLRGLFDAGIIDRLVSKGFLIGSEIAPFSLDGFGMVLRHSPIPFLSYPFDWCGEMFRDAAVLICDLGLELRAVDLQLKDMHPWNVMFEGCQPRFVDIGSIVPYENGRTETVMREFISTCIYALQGMASGKSNEVRRLLACEFDDTRLGQRLYHLLPFHRRLAVRLFRTQLTLLSSNGGLRKLRTSIERLSFKPATTEWSSYALGDSDYFLPFQRCGKWFDKQRSVHDVLLRLQPKTVIDIGCNIGWFSELAAKQGCRVLAMDLDEPSISALHERAKARSLPIHPIILDFVKSTASHIALSPPSELYRGDLALALALVHHLVFKNNCRFELIARELSKYTKKCLLVEFVPPEDYFVKDWMSENYRWYSLENFVLALKRFFRNIELMDSTPRPRKLILCEK